MKLIVTLALIAVTCHASSALRQNLKNVQLQDESQIREALHPEFYAKDAEKTTVEKK